MHHTTYRLRCSLRRGTADRVLAIEVMSSGGSRIAVGNNPSGQQLGRSSLMPWCLRVHLGQSRYSGRNPGWKLAQERDLLERRLVYGLQA
jgi:hypothetical protein